MRKIFSASTREGSRRRQSRPNEKAHKKQDNSVVSNAHHQKMGEEKGKKDRMKSRTPKRKEVPGIEEGKGAPERLQKIAKQRGWRMRDDGGEVNR